MKSASGIVNKPVATSFLSMNSSTKGASLKGCTKSSSTDSPPDNGKTVEFWHDMECRLQYMQVQVREKIEETNFTIYNGLIHYSNSQS